MNSEALQDSQVSMKVMSCIITQGTKNGYFLSAHFTVVWD